jgi:anti-sigma-K factor RskA
MVTMDEQGAHGDAAAYVLGALDAAGRARFEAHAATCPDCLRDVAAFRDTTDRLALAVPQVDPPPQLGARIMARARELLPELEPAPLQVPPPIALVPPPVRRGWLEWSSRLSLGVAAISLMLAAVGGGLAFNSNQRLEQTAQSAAQLAETLQIMYQPGMITKSLNGTEISPQAKGKIWIVPDANQAVIMTYDMPQLAQGESYQCWLNDEGQGANGGVFKVDERGRGYLLVRAPEVMYRYKWVGVTREPAKGSKRPTGPRMLSGQL